MFSPTSVVSFKDLGQFNEFFGSRKFNYGCRPVYPLFFDDLSIGFFYGSSSLYGEICACGAVLKLLDGVAFHVILNVGSGTNSKVELLGLWVLLIFARVRMIDQFQVVGDSKLMIDWALNKCSFKATTLVFWQQRICSLKEEFPRLEFFHIYREFNMGADILASQASSLEVGKIFVQHHVGGVVRNEFFIPLFWFFSLNSVVLNFLTSD
jgi:ribonuclease HI